MHVENIIVLLTQAICDIEQSYSITCYSKACLNYVPLYVSCINLVSMEMIYIILKRWVIRCTSHNKISMLRATMKLSYSVIDNIMLGRYLASYVI